MNIKLIAILILCGLFLLFVVQNIAMVEVQFLIWSARMPRSMLMFLALAVGVVIGWFTHGQFKKY